LNDDATNPQSSAHDGYISFVARLWVGEDGKLIRGTIEDVHTGTQLALDLSELVGFLQTSLAHSPEQALDLRYEGVEDVNQERPNESEGRDPSDANTQYGDAQSPQNGDKG
jgi:hypothetical protein